MLWTILLFLLAAMIAAFLILLYSNAKNIKLDRKDLYLPDWPQGFEGVRFLFITDLHRECIPESILKELEKERIDLVILGGDMTEKGEHLSRVRDKLEPLVTLAPTYFVWGNHDYRTDYRSLDTMLRDIGIHVLDNRAALFEAGEDKLWLIGVDEYSLYRDDLSLAVKNIEQNGYHLLVSHNPKIIRKLEENTEVRAVLSGHTHGGQICPLGISPLLLDPFFRRYRTGEYLFFHGRTKLFISNGAGTSRLPLRLGAPPEIHLFTLKRKK